MTTPFPDINCCIPDIVRVSESGSSPYRGNFRLEVVEAAIAFLK
jgi:hypothetical protein